MQPQFLSEVCLIFKWPASKARAAHRRSILTGQMPWAEWIRGSELKRKEDSRTKEGHFWSKTAVAGFPNDEKIGSTLNSRVWLIHCVIHDVFHVKESMWLKELTVDTHPPLPNHSELEVSPRAWERWRRNVRRRNHDLKFLPAAFFSIYIPKKGCIKTQTLVIWSWICFIRSFISYLCFIAPTVESGLGH